MRETLGLIQEIQFFLNVKKNIKTKIKTKAAWPATAIDTIVICRINKTNTTVTASSLFLSYFNLLWLNWSKLTSQMLTNSQSHVWITVTTWAKPLLLLTKSFLRPHRVNRESELEVNPQNTFSTSQWTPLWDLTFPSGSYSLEGNGDSLSLGLDLQVVSACQE